MFAPEFPPALLSLPSDEGSGLKYPLEVPYFEPFGLPSDEGSGLK